MKARKASKTAVAPSRPSSLAIAEKTKSVSTSGMVWAKPAPSPVPSSPPSAMLKMLWRIWNPVPSGSLHGSSQLCTRNCTCSKRRKVTKEPKGGGPDEGYGSEVLYRRKLDTEEAAARRRHYVSLLGQVSGEEDHECDAGELRWLEVDRPEVDPEPRPVDRVAEGRERGGDQ